MKKMLQTIYKIISLIQTKLIEFIGFIFTCFLIFFVGKKIGKQELKEQENNNTIQSLQKYETIKNDVANLNTSELDKLLEKNYRD